MTYVKSLPEPEHGYKHRTHRSKKGRKRGIVQRKELKRIIQELQAIQEKKYRRWERKFK